ncbi:endolytic transglycosylase MltG [Candidatus Peregrinibacteria bacterium CG10_big_fil_rev_8_21_14_0_10_36_19]|nr:MAG: endolytic transglycosylase MltG [Candidatus Peregrinibacteria bacterium CG10_big_fil_rev_8_21_14_0_10_36_19]
MARNKKFKRKIKRFIIFTLIISLFLYHKYSTYIYVPFDENNTEEIAITIKKGESIKEIASDLKEKKLIRNAFTFRYFIKHNNLDKNIFAGRFHLQQSMNVPKIIEKLSNKADAEYIITIQEGLTIKDIDAKLVELELIKSGDFISAVENFNGWEYYNFLDKEDLSKLKLPLEGYLYPDTYYLDPGTFKPHHLIYLALDNFEKKYSEINKNSPILKKYGLENVITMASIIENEVFGEVDRKMVSDILWRRLENGWTIGADATLLYITDDRTITKSDLAIDSPYNTRKNTGLPPGPISNPSTSSINAALNPTPNNYWFYLTTLDTGKVIYAKTNEEQNINRAKYL